MSLQRLDFMVRMGRTVHMQVMANTHGRQCSVIQPGEYAYSEGWGRGGHQYQVEAKTLSREGLGVEGPVQEAELVAEGNRLLGHHELEGLRPHLAGLPKQLDPLEVAIRGGTWSIWLLRWPAAIC